MNMQVLIPLTDRERSFAERNHDYVLQFMLRNELEMDDYYDVLIFRYLKAVKQFLAQKQARDFATHVNKALGLALRDWSKKQASLERFELPLSLNTHVSEHLTLQDLIAGDTGDLDDELIDFQACEYLLARLTGVQRQAVEMRADGYTSREIARKIRMPRRSLGRLFAEIRAMYA